MKKIDTIFSLLLLLLLMGGFASMARNDYGTTLLGVVSACFAAVFLYQMYVTAKGPGTKWTGTVEFLSVAVISFIMSLRVFQLYFPFVEVIFEAAAGLLVILYLVKTVRSFSGFRSDSRRISLLTVIFYTSIALFAASVFSALIAPSISEVLGIVAFVLALMFLTAIVVTRKVVVNGENRTVLQAIKQPNDSSIVLLAIFLIISLYTALTSRDVLPRIYSSEFPQGYFELVKKAEMGMEKPVNGKYRHQEFKEAYRKFVRK